MDFSGPSLKKILSPAIFLIFTETCCIDVLKFGDPKDSSAQMLKIGNITDDTYEIYVDVPDVPFPVGQDLTICYRWFFDQIRFTDPGSVDIHLKFYRNQTDIEGVDEIINFGTRGLPYIRDRKDFLKISPPPKWDLKYRNASWYNNLMINIGGGNMYNHWPQVWRSFCHMVDWEKRQQTTVVNGERLFSEPLRENVDYFLDADKDWPKAKMTHITVGPKLHQFTSGKTVGTLTDMNIFSGHIGDGNAINITGIPQIISIINPDLFYFRLHYGCQWRCILLG